MAKVPTSGSKSPKKTAGNPSRSRSRGGSSVKLWGLLAFVICSIAILVALLWRKDDSPGSKDNDRRPSLIEEYNKPGFTPLVKIDTVTVAPGVKIKGMVALADMVTGIDFLTVPWNKCLNIETMYEEALSLCSKCMDVPQLAFGLALEKRNPRVTFRTYIENLPPQLMNWVSFDEQQLKFTQAREGAKFTNVMVRWLEEILGAGESLKPPLTEQEALWALGVVQSRSFSIHLGKGTKRRRVQTLIPTIDMVNHHASKPIASPPFCSEEIGTCILEVDMDQKVRAGEHLWGNYGEWSNMDLLIRYGFSMKDNKIGPKFLREDKYESKNLWLKEVLGCPKRFIESGWQLSVDAPGKISTEILMCLTAERALESEEEAKANVAALKDEGCLRGTAPCKAMPERLAAASALARGMVGRECATKLQQQRPMLKMLLDMSLRKDSTSQQLHAAGRDELKLLKDCVDAHADVKLKEFFESEEWQLT